MKKYLLISLAIFFTLNSNIVWSSEHETNPGFRDLRPGLTIKEFYTHCNSLVCYGIKNIKFYTKYSSSIKRDGSSVIHTVILDMGPIASEGVIIDLINEFADPDANIFRKMKTNFDTKYIPEYEFSQRDRQLFNEREKSELYVVYSKGQVALRIDSDFSLYVEYRDKDLAKSFLEENRPITATLDDF